MRIIPNDKENMKKKKKNKYEENPEPKIEYEKIYTRKTLNQKDNMRKKFF